MRPWPLIIASTMAVAIAVVLRVIDASRERDFWESIPAGYDLYAKPLGASPNERLETFYLMRNGTFRSFFRDSSSGKWRPVMASGSWKRVGYLVTLNPDSVDGEKKGDITKDVSFGVIAKEDADVYPRYLAPRSFRIERGVPITLVATNDPLAIDHAILATPVRYYREARR